jgi:cysteine-rich repeat protein
MAFATRFTRAVFVIVAIFAAGASQAAPFAVGPEFSAEDRPIPAEGWWKSCIDDRGVRATLLPECADGECRGPQHLVVERTDPAGNLLTPPVRITTAPAEIGFFRAACEASGQMLLQWQDGTDGCFLHRRMDGDGNLVTEPARTSPARYDCRARPSVAVRADGSFVAVWGAAHLGGGSGVVAQSFDTSAAAVGPSIFLTEGALGWNRQPKVAIDQAGAALVAWAGDALGAGAEPILARWITVDASGVTPLGDVLRLDTFGFGANAPPTVATERAGEFTVVWSNPYQGGRVARRVSTALDDTLARDVATARNVASNVVPPGFGAERIVDSWPAPFVELDPATVALGSGPSGRWMVTTEIGLHQITDDDGATWSAPSTASASGGVELASGLAPEGTVIAVVTGDRRDTLYFARSRDGGDTWTRPAPMAPVLGEGTRCEKCSVQRVAVSSSTDGAEWVVAWSVRAARASRDGSPAATRVFAVFSDDGGKRWSRVRTVAEEAGSGIGGFDLASRDGRTWLLLWVDDDVRIARSKDAGSTWSPPVTLMTAVSCTDCALARRFRRAQLAGDDAGRWIAVLAAARFETSRYGHDGDIFALRSLDHGSTWSAPIAIASYARSDGSREMEPTIATDGAGRWTAMWTSHRVVGAGDGMDPDIVMSVTSDAGLTWSEPVPARPHEVTESVLDWSPRLAADGNGVWLATWQRRDYVETKTTERLLAAAADAQCGNRQVDPGEHCDDGNRKENDRCASNCTRPRCGNGIVEAGEECDDGNHRNDDSCSTQCVGPRCGDAVVQEDEECDDGNTADDDECPTSCRYNRCGDGHVDVPVEECDDGNGSNHDACTTECRNAYCGDGYLQDFIEACDDGNRIDDDTCPNACDRAVCGDGHTARGIEECDPVDPMFREICTDDCRIIDLCGDADGDGSVSVVDVQRMLRRSVGLSARCPREVCDMDGSGSVRTRDAQLGIGVAVGLDVGARCSIGTGNVVFWIDYAGEIGALQIEVDYSKTGGSFVGSAGAVACEPVAPGIDHSAPGDENPSAMGFAAFNDDEEQKLLKFAMVSAFGFSGPMDLFRCAFVLPEGREGVRLVVRPVDATSPEFDAIVPPPMFGYRLE